ncbi:uncharacterized protein K452DRAFT_282772 [Aplosporella prunicola CBS 121167]|uniref:Exonuclease domain-containing protein n=1 Tax=Aplosporella prunicola CBS 121167 TaxID=1176127 RepID=A0A6A6BV85_9PEZI|nr:uncharacterized protein K452DRAFT_282772 [Aplosporella prunicola CBS 121167]KAF2146591.1 hypothetical protein K452DRAFT_282772 [Aplosporella prunicola CBS 121167]
MAQKRSHEEFAERSTEGTHEHKDNDATTDNASGGDWETAENRATKKLKKVPKQQSNNYPSISHSSSARLQSIVKIGDLQALALYILGDGNAPQWVAVKNKQQIRRFVIVMVPGLEAGMFNGTIPLEDSAAQAQAQEGEAQDTNGKLAMNPDDYYPVKLVADKLPEPLRPFADMFPHIWPIKTPGDDKFSKVHSPLQAILNSPLPKGVDEKKKKGPQPPRGEWKNQRTSITEYLATSEELLENEYPLHPAYYTTPEEKEAALQQRTAAEQDLAHGWLDTPVEKLEDGEVPDQEIEQGSLTAGRNVLTMDCEMCKTAEDTYELTRISLVKWDGSVLMDELVKPDRPIIDYLTPYSGITEEMLRPVTTTLSDIQKKLMEVITPRTILVGHSLDSDLKALKITHPFIVDTSILYPHPRGPPLKSSLKWLSQKYLQREIQKQHGSTGHDSVEDARACLDLVRQKCERGKRWGTNDANSESIFKRLGRNKRPKNQAMAATGEEPRTGAVVDWGEPKRGFGAAAEAAIGCGSDADVVEGIKKVVVGTGRGPEQADIPSRGVDFVWARMRELEAVRGWWTRTKSADNAVLLANALAKMGPAADNSTANASDESTATATKTTNPAVPTTGPGADADINLASPSAEVSPSQLGAAVKKTADHLKELYDSFPPCTAFVVYSGTGDPRETQRLQELKQQFHREYKTKKWDELNVHWTDVEDQALRRACKKARAGVGFMVVK